MSVVTTATTGSSVHANHSRQIDNMVLCAQCDVRAEAVFVFNSSVVSWANWNAFGEHSEFPRKKITKVFQR